jgi:hypothetical protein
LADRFPAKKRCAMVDGVVAAEPDDHNSTTQRGHAAARAGGVFASVDASGNPLTIVDPVTGSRSRERD